MEFIGKNCTSRLELVSECNNFSWAEYCEPKFVRTEKWYEGRYREVQVNKANQGYGPVDEYIISSDGKLINSKTGDVIFSNGCEIQYKNGVFYDDEKCFIVPEKMIFELKGTVKDIEIVDGCVFIKYVQPIQTTRTGNVVEIAENVAIPSLTYISYAGNLYCALSGAKLLNEIDYSRLTILNNMVIITHVEGGWFEKTITHKIFKIVRELV